MSRGTPQLVVRADAELRQQIEEYRCTHELPDTATTVRALIKAGLQPPKIDHRTWLEKRLQLHRAQKWYAEARAALLD